MRDCTRSTFKRRWSDIPIFPPLDSTRATQSEGERQQICPPSAIFCPARSSNALIEPRVHTSPAPLPQLAARRRTRMFSPPASAAAGSSERRGRRSSFRICRITEERDPFSGQPAGKRVPFCPEIQKDAGFLRFPAQRACGREGKRQGLPAFADRSCRKEREMAFCAGISPGA